MAYPQEALALADGALGVLLGFLAVEKALLLGFETGDDRREVGLEQTRFLN